MKEENIRVNYKTIDIVEQRGLLEITRDLGRLLTKEEFDEIMMVYKKVTDRLLAEAGKQGMDIQEINEDLLRKYIFHNQVLRIHNEAVAETYLEDAYNDDEELKDDMEHTLKKSQKIREIEEELLKELNK